MLSSHFTPSVKAGGPVQSVRAMLSQAPSHVHVTLLTGDHDLGGPTFEHLSGKRIPVSTNAEVFYLRSGPRVFLLDLWRGMTSREFDVIYINGLWAPRMALFPALLITLTRTMWKIIIFAPRGELDPGAYALGKTRLKRIATKVYRRLAKKSNVYFHVTSQLEAKNTKTILGQTTKAILASTYSAPDSVKPERAREHNLDSVFISRISPKKGLLQAIKSLANVQGDISLHIYGPIEDQNYWDKCISAIDTLKLGKTVVYKGELKNEDVIPTLSKYSVLVLPTKGENFGHIIAEALSVGTVPIVTETTPWTDLLQRNQVPTISGFSDFDVAEALEKWFRFSEESKAVISENLQEDFYRWVKVQEVSTIYQIALSNKHSG